MAAKTTHADVFQTFFDGITRNHSPPASSSFMASDASYERSASERLRKGELVLFLEFLHLLTHVPFQCRENVLNLFLCFCCSNITIRALKRSSLQSSPELLQPSMSGEFILFLATRSVPNDSVRLFIQLRRLMGS